MAFFTYGNEFLKALSLGEKEFTVLEKKERNEDLSELNKYDAMTKSVLYDSRASYFLHSDSSAYVNFNDLKHASLIGSIHEYADEHIVQCGHTQNIPDGTFLVGSAKGSWAMNSVVEEAVKASLSHLPPNHLAMRVEKGLTLLRKVISKEVYHTGHSGSLVICSKLHTENVHPLELFSKMKVESMSENPFHQKYSERPTDTVLSSSPQTSRKDLSNVLQPDYPWSCDSSAGGSAIPRGSGDSYSFQLGRTQGCMMYSADSGNYNFNYDPVSGTLIDEIDFSHCHQVWGNSLFFFFTFLLGLT